MTRQYMGNSISQPVNSEIDQFIARQSNNSEDQTQINTFVKDAQIPSAVAIFISKFINQNPLTTNDFNQFISELDQIKNNDVHDCIVGIMQRIAEHNFVSQEEKIQTAQKEIDNAVRNRYPIPNRNNASDSLRSGLMNSYLLLNIHNENIKFRNYPGMTFPGNSINRELVSHHIPLAINALKLTGQIANMGTYCDIDMSKPLYPWLKAGFFGNDYEKLDESQTFDEKRGVKPASQYVPYKPVSKIAKGPGNNTFIATNGEKVLYIRGVVDYAPSAVLASKIATFINPEQFSSERVLTNRLVGSKQLSDYAISLADHAFRKSLQNHLLDSEKMMAGIATIDEVLNYVKETDDNVENYGFSETDTKKFNEGNFSKIDFDGSNLESNIQAENYETNLLSSNLYNENNKSPQAKLQYMEEKLTTRMKLCFMTKELIAGLAEKAYSSNEDEKEHVKAELLNRTNIALHLLVEDKNLPYLKKMLQDDPHLLAKLYAESEMYVSTHFDAPERDIILKSLEIQAKEICNTVNKACGLNIQPNIQWDNQNKVHSEYAKEFIDKLQQITNSLSTQDPIPTFVTTINNILSKNANDSVAAIIALKNIPKIRAAALNTSSSDVGSQIKKAIEHFSPPLSTHTNDNQSTLTKPSLTGTKAGEYLQQAQINTQNITAPKNETKLEPPRIH